MSVGRIGGSVRIACRCGLGSEMEWNGEINSAFLRFLHGYDQGERPRMEEKIIRSEADISEMIGGADPDDTMLDILHTKHDYVCWYRASDSPGPPPGDAVRDAGLDARLAKYLEGSGIQKMYRFQQEALDTIVRGEDTVIVAPTASGKTEAFLIPIMQMLAEGRRAVFAIIAYPTKALARDQHSKIEGMAASVGASSAVFDGDTPPGRRQHILDSPPHILVTNFDVINYHLPRRTAFAALLRTARILVIDEVHTYSGIFGSNVHHILRRLGRVCGRLQMVAASATISEPARFCSHLLDRDTRIVQTGGRRGRIDMVMLFPATRPQRQMMLDMTRRLTKQNHKTLVFSNSHRGAELFAMDAKRSGMDVRVHRAGLPARHRRQTESMFRGGGLMAISCTPTLELGIDIGAVDGVVSAVVPVNRLLQRVGRAARKGQRGYALLALGDDPISQYYRSRPGDYFEDVEVPYIDPGNPIVRRYHLAAMSCDAPLRAGDIPARHQDAMQECIDAGLVDNHGGVLAPNMEKMAKLLREYSIRGMGRAVDIVLERRSVGERSLPMALGELHPGATYYMAGSAYRVESLDVPGLRRAVLKPIYGDHPRTRPLIADQPTIRSTIDTKTVWGMQVAHCNLTIRKTVTGYVEEFGDYAGRTIHLDTPASFDFETKGVVFCAPYPEDAADSADAAAGAYHAAEHTIIEGSNMITGGAAKDLGGISLGETGAIFVYDSAIGGNGASRALYDRMAKAIDRSAQILRLCPCKSGSGCPRCTHSYRCGNNNEFLNKAAALEVLTRIMDGQRCELDIPQDTHRTLV
ncbi:MAG: DEAD/DEAH box helicase [Nitrosopumilaceae archaeon]|nr:DEAD/DEAH box helicase [Nitrosopumilaceae archaeon]